MRLRFTTIILTLPLMLNILPASAKIDEGLLPTPVPFHTTLEEVIKSAPCTLEGKIKPGKKIQVLSCSDYPLRGTNTETAFWFYDGLFEKVIYAFDKTRASDIKGYINDDFGPTDTENNYNSLKSQFNDVTFNDETIVWREIKERNFIQLFVISYNIRNEPSSYSG